MNKHDKFSKISTYIYFVIVGFLFVFFSLTGRELAFKGNLIWTQRFTLSVLGISLGAGGLLGAALCFFLYKVKAGCILSTGTLGKRLSEIRLFQKSSGVGCGKVFGVSLFLILLCWLPGYLAYYPAICSYDTPIQIAQIRLHQYNDHHPIIHTLLIKWTMDLGQNFLNSVNAGIGIYALLQMLFLASVFAFTMTYFWRNRERYIWILLLQLFYMIYPFHLYMSISVTKDTIFSGFFVLQVLTLCRIIQSRKTEKMPSKTEILFFFSSVGMLLFRNNGKYTFLVFLFFLVLTVLFAKEKKRFFGKLLLWSVGAFFVGNVILKILFTATGAVQGDKREMLSVPIQQLARTMIYHGGVGVIPEDDGTLDEEAGTLINEFIQNEAYRKYRPDIADPVKRDTYTYVVRYQAKEFITVYLKLLNKYPGDFINAVLALDAGYLYPGDITHAYVNAQEGQEVGLGYVQTRWDEKTLNVYGIYKASKWPGLHKVMEQWADDNAYLELPVLKYMFVPGIWLYLYLVLFGWLLLRRAFRLCLPLSLVFGYFLTLFLGPTVQLRYIYPLMIVFPFLALLCRGRSLE